MGVIMKIGLIAGSGQFPIFFSKKANSKGLSVYAAAHINETDSELQKHVDAIEWIHIGQIEKVIKFFKTNNIKKTIMIGAINKTRMFTDARLDMKAVSLLSGLKNTNDDRLLRSFAKLLEDNGITMLPSTFILPDILATKGCWTKRKPTASDKLDINIGWEIAKKIGAHDIGQCVVVGGGSVLAVEAIDGTDSTILRGGKLGKENAVVVKVCKPNQDTRFDIPAVGVQTVRIMKDAKAKVLAIEAGKAVVFDRCEMICLADKFGISIVAIDHEYNI